MTDNTNKGFWERMARIYTAFMSKNDTAYRQICKLSEQYIDSEKSVLELACGTGQITFLMTGKSGFFLKPYRQFGIAPFINKGRSKQNSVFFQNSVYFF